MTGTNLVMLVVILLLLVVLIFLAIAEMGLSKMTKPRAAAITEHKPRIEPSLTAIVENPEGWINPLLLMVNVCQTVQATLTGIVAGSLFGGVGVAAGTRGRSDSGECVRWRDRTGSPLGGDGCAVDDHACSRVTPQWCSSWTANHV